MRKKWKELHQEVKDLETEMELTTVHGLLSAVKICAEQSNNFEEFAEFLNHAIDNVEELLDK